MEVKAIESRGKRSVTMKSVEHLAKPKLPILNKATRALKTYKESVNAIVDLFCEKQDMDFEYWVAGTIGEVCEISGFFFNFSDIVTDLEKKAKPGVIISWHNDNADSEKYINYNSYIMGLRISDIEN